MSAEPVTWPTTHGDTVEVYYSPTFEPTGVVEQDGEDLLIEEEEVPRWRYRVKAANGRVVETGSEGYTRKHAAIKAALRHHPRVGEP